MFYNISDWKYIIVYLKRSNIIVKENKYICNKKI